MDLKELESAIEGILFAAGEPVPVERLCLTLEQDRETVDSVCQRMADSYRYERRGIRLLRLENSWQMCSAPEQAGYIRKVLENRKPAKLSQPALEVLAIIAYFQPVTRAYIEQVRGVDSSYTVGLLLERELIREAGRLAVPGRPMQFRTTKTFLRAFGLSSLDELPELPSATQEEAQLALEMESALRRLREAENAQASEAEPAGGRRHDLFQGAVGCAGRPLAHLPHPRGREGELRAGGAVCVPSDGAGEASAVSHGKCVGRELEVKGEKAQKGKAAHGGKA